MTPTARTIKRWIPEILKKEQLHASELAKKLREVWDKKKSPYEVLYAYDKEVRNHGIEHAVPDDSPSHRKGILYSNTGESYSVTLTFDYDLRKFRFDSWGGYIERNS